jgi:UDPglucose 6-dehydrogenase
VAQVLVVGAGHVGLVVAAGFARLGNDVRAVEVNPAALELLSRGTVPFAEPGLGELMAPEITSGRLRFLPDLGDGSQTADLIFVAVATPTGADGEADIGAVRSVADRITRTQRTATTLVIKSTVPVGTGDEIQALADVRGAPVTVLSNPEFLSQGSAVRNFLAPDRIVIGSPGREQSEPLRDLYRRVQAPIIETDRRTAELSKYASNIALAARVSLINEIAGLSRQLGADIDGIAAIVGSDARIGPRYLEAGLGWGGSCLPKDLRAMAALAESHGLATPLIQAIRDVNDGQPTIICDVIEEAIGSSGRVAVLGLAYKPLTDDLAESPAVAVVQALLARGLTVVAHDPMAMPAARSAIPGLSLAESPEDAAVGADAVLIATGWPEYRVLDWGRMAARMRGGLVVDARGVADRAAVLDVGLRCWAFGRDGSRPVGGRGAAGGVRAGAASD